eukprot:213193_1
MESNALEIVCFVCMAIGICLPLWSIFAFKDIVRYRTKGKYPSVEIRDYSFLIFSSVVWSICSIIYSLFIYLIYIHYPAHINFNFCIRLILYSFELFGILSLLIVKICKLYYNIHKLIDDEKWFCCHIIDKYWLHSFYIINYELVGRSSYLLLFCCVYFSFGILMITFCSIFSYSLKNNILMEYISLFIISIIPMILIFYIYKNIKYNTKYFVDDHFLLQEISISIIIYFIQLWPPLITIIIFNNNIILIYIIQIITNTISCSLLIIISLKFGIWAAINRENIIKQERNKLKSISNVNKTISYYESKYEHTKRLSALNETISNDQLKSLRLESASIESNSASNSASNSPRNIQMHHIHTSTSQTNKARTPANFEMFTHTKSKENSFAPYAFANKYNKMNCKTKTKQPYIDSIEKIFFKDLLNFRFGFYIFSEYLYNNKALNNLAFIAELEQFKKELNIQLNTKQYHKKKLISKKYNWIKNIDLKFLPRGDCQYMASNQNNIVFQAWNIYKKYINAKIINKNDQQLNISITEPIAYKIGNILESIYQQYQFLYSQKKYYLKYKKNKNMYIECFEELVSENPNDIYCQLLLGDAYLNIQRTSDAICSYERALMISNYDIKLSLKFGRALISSHDYQRAILHFEATLANYKDKNKEINNNNNIIIDIKTELAELYIQFEEYNKAKILLMESISTNSQTFHDLNSNVKILRLFADLYQNAKRWKDTKSLLIESWRFQQKLLSLANSSGKDIKPIENISSEICYNLGFVYLQLNDITNAHQYLTKSIEFNIKHENAMIEIAKLYKIKGNYQLAKEKLKSILSFNQNNENAIILLSNICIECNDLKTAINELILFHKVNSLNMNVLLILITLLKRNGEFQKIKDLMNEYNNKNNICVGLYYIKGYILWYIDNDNVLAINELNKIRTDVIWGPLAIILMIKIYLYLNPSFTFIDIMIKYTNNSINKHLEICQYLM